MSEPSLDEILSSIDELLRDTNLELPSRSDYGNNISSSTPIKSAASKSAHTDTVATVTDSYDLLADVEATLHQLDVGISDMFSNTSTRATELQTMDLTEPSESEKSTSHSSRSSYSSSSNSPSYTKVAKTTSLPQAEDTPDLFLSTLQDDEIDAVSGEGDVYQDLLGFEGAQAATKNISSSTDTIDKTIEAQPDLTPAEVIANNILAAKEAQAQVGANTIGYQNQKNDDAIYEIGDLDLSMAADDNNNNNNNNKEEENNNSATITAETAKETSVTSNMGDEFSAVSSDAAAFADAEVSIPKSNSFNSLLTDSQQVTEYAKQNASEAQAAAEAAMEDQMAVATKIAKQVSIEDTQDIDAQQGFDAAALFDLSDKVVVKQPVKDVSEPITNTKKTSAKTSSKAVTFIEKQRRHPAIARDNLLTDENQEVQKKDNSKDLAQQLRFELTTEMMAKNATDPAPVQVNNLNKTDKIGKTSDLTNTQIRCFARAVIHESLMQLEENLWIRIERRLDSLLQTAIDENK